MIEINDKIIEQGRFPDGTLLMKYFDTTILEYNLINWKYEGDNELFALICLVKHIREHNPTAYISLRMSYLPNARQDRVKDTKDIFTLKYFCEIINSLNFNEVLVTDVHSNVGIALLDRARNIQPYYTIQDVIYDIPDDNKLIAFYPDEGAMKRYQNMVNLPFTFGVKRRDWETGKIEGLDIAGDIDLIKGSDVLIIDDICSRGGTFMWSADKLKEAGAANIYLYVTHCENTIHEGDLLKETSPIKHIYTTDSLLTKPHEKITIM